MCNVCKILLGICLGFAHCSLFVIAFVPSHEGSTTTEVVLTTFLGFNRGGFLHRMLISFFFFKVTFLLTSAGIYNGSSAPFTLLSFMGIVVLSIRKSLSLRLLLTVSRGMTFGCSQDSAGYHCTCNVASGIRAVRYLEYIVCNYVPSSEANHVVIATT